MNALSSLQVCQILQIRSVLHTSSLTEDNKQLPHTKGIFDGVLSLPLSLSLSLSFFPSFSLSSPLSLFPSPSLSLSFPLSLSLVWSDEGLCRGGRKENTCHTEQIITRVPTNHGAPFISPFKNARHSTEAAGW